MTETGHIWDRELYSNIHKCRRCNLRTYGPRMEIMTCDERVARLVAKRLISELDLNDVIGQKDPEGKNGIPNS